MNQLAGVAFLTCRGGTNHRRRTAQFTDKFWQENPELMKNLALEEIATHKGSVDIFTDASTLCLKKKTLDFFIITLANVKRFSEFFHSHIRKKIL